MVCPNCGFDRAVNITIHWVQGDEQYFDCPCTFSVDREMHLDDHSFASLFDFQGLEGLSKTGNIFIGPPGVGKTHLLYSLKKYFQTGKFVNYRDIAQECLKFEPDLTAYYDIKFLDEFDIPDKNSCTGVLDRWLCSKVGKGVWVSSNMSLKTIQDAYSPRLADRLRPHTLHLSGASLRGSEKQKRAYGQKLHWWRQWLQYRNSMDLLDHKKVLEKIRNHEPVTEGELLKLDSSSRNKYLRQLLKKSRHEPVYDSKKRHAIF